MKKISNGQKLPNTRNTSSPTILENLTIPCDTALVSANFNYYVTYFTEQVLSLFKWHELTNGLTSHDIERSIIGKGYALIPKSKWKNKYIVQYQSSLYYYDEYYVPNKYVYTNVLTGGGRGVIPQDAIIIWGCNLDKFTGTSLAMETIKHYSMLLANLDSTYTNLQYRLREGQIAQVPNNKTGELVNEFFKKVKAGNVESVVNDDMMLNELKPIFSENKVTGFNYGLEREQIIKGFWEQMGYNKLLEKKERLIEDEVDNDDELTQIPLLNMLNERKKSLPLLRELLGTEVDVTLRHDMGV